MSEESGSDVGRSVDPFKVSVYSWVNKHARVASSGSSSSTSARGNSVAAGTRQGVECSLLEYVVHRTITHTNAIQDTSLAPPKYDGPISS